MMATAIDQARQGNAWKPRAEGVALRCDQPSRDVCHVFLDPGISAKTHRTDAGAAKMGQHLVPKGAKQRVRRDDVFNCAVECALVGDPECGEARCNPL